MLLPQTTLARLKMQHEVTEVLIFGLSEGDLHYRPITDKWSVHENIAHLACYQPRIILRTKRILAEENPSFKSYIPEGDPEFKKYLSMTIDELLSYLKSNKLELFQLISNLNDEQLKRTGSHSKFGKMNLIEWTEFFCFMRHIIFTQFLN